MDSLPGTIEGALRTVLGVSVPFRRKIPKRRTSSGDMSMAEKSISPAGEAFPLPSREEYGAEMKRLEALVVDPRARKLLKAR